MISLRQIHEQYNTQESCMALLVEMRWPDGVACPRCGNQKVFRIAKKNWTWVCKSGKESVNEDTGLVSVCHKKNGYRFSALVGTVFENTNYPLPLWFEVIYLICQSKKGMSALQVQRMLQENGKLTAYKTAFYMCHRVRAMLGNDEAKLEGIVEADETYVGGKDRNRHWNKKSAQVRKAKGQQPIGEAIGYGKTGVIGAIARKGNVVCRVIGDTDARTLSGFVRDVVSDKVSLVATDENISYKYMGLPHASVNHSRGEYVRGNVHTNNLESFWSLLKRGVIGTYHNVSKKYLALYLNEFSWRFNNRKNPDIFRAAIAGC
jgi:ISXO2-like transposase domain/Transposase zinc-ribbon domain